jgi:hypothetical protein
MLRTSQDKLTGLRLFSVSLMIFRSCASGSSFRIPMRQRPRSSKAFVCF